MVYVILFPVVQLLQSLEFSYPHRGFSYNVARKQSDYVHSPVIFAALEVTHARYGGPVAIIACADGCAVLEQQLDDCEITTFMHRYRHQRCHSLASSFVNLGTVIKQQACRLVVI